MSLLPCDSPLYITVRDYGLTFARTPVQKLVCVLQSECKTTVVSVSFNLCLSRWRNDRARH